MIDRIIEFSARNRFLVFLFVAAAALAGWWSMQTHPAGRHSRPERHAGDRLLALGPQPGHPGGPGHVPDRHRHAGRAQGEGRARLFAISATRTCTSSSKRARTFTGRARARWSISRKILPRLPQGRADGTRSGCHRRGLGLPIRAGRTTGSTTWPSCAALQDWFLRYHLQAVPGVAEVAPLGGFVRQYQVNVDPNRLRLTAFRFRKWWRRCAAATTMWADGWWNSPGASTWCAAAAMRSRTADLEALVAGGQRLGRAGPGARRGQRDAGSRHAPRHRRSGRQGRSGLRHRGDAAGRERAARDRAREGEAEGDRAGPAGGREDGHGLRPLAS